jgi:hypothetical protein
MNSIRCSDVICVGSIPRSCWSGASRQNGEERLGVAWGVTGDSACAEFICEGFDIMGYDSLEDTVLWTHGFDDLNVVHIDINVKTMSRTLKETTTVWIVNRTSPLLGK